MPFLIKTQNLKSNITPEHAKRNLAQSIKFFQHFKDPLTIDQVVNQFYVIMYEADHLHSEHYHLW